MSGEYEVRAIRVDDWAAVKELRLAALRDPVAPVAFMETYEQARAKPDGFWRERAAMAADGGPNRQFVAEGRQGCWAGSVTVLVEEPGTVDFLGERVARRQAHLVGVFVREEHRGGAVARELVRSAVAWGLAREGVRRVRLLVHQENGRAQAFYRKAGFERLRTVGEEYEMAYRPAA